MLGGVAFRLVAYPLFVVKVTTALRHAEVHLEPFAMQHTSVIIAYTQSSLLEAPDRIRRRLKEIDWEKSRTGCVVGILVGSFGVSGRALQVHNMAIFTLEALNIRQEIFKPIFRSHASVGSNTTESTATTKK